MGKNLLRNVWNRNLLFFITIFLLHQQISAQSSWRKCCPESQILDMKLKQCVHEKYTSNKTYEYKFLAGKSSVLKQINPIFKGKQEALDCESKHKFPFTREHFLVIIQELKNQGVNGLIYLPSQNSNLLVVSVNDFCFDRLLKPNGSITPGVLVCACHKSPCISTCQSEENEKSFATNFTYRFKPQMLCTKREKIRKGKYEINGETGELTVGGYIHERSQYCINKEGDVLSCKIEDSPRTVHIVLLVILFLSFFCLFITVLIFLICSEFRTREAGYFQLFMYLNLMIVFLLLFISKQKSFFLNDAHKPSCYAIAFIIQYCSLASFSCMTTSSYYFWMKLRTIQYPEARGMSSLGHVFSFGLPFVIVALTIAIQFGFDNSGIRRLTSFNESTTDLRAYFHPGVGEQSCFLYSLVPRILYYEIPIFVLLCLNLICFISIFYNMFWGTWRSSSLTSSNFVIKDRILLLLKLFFLMGINWFLETLLVLLHGFQIKSKFTIISEFINSSTGIFLLISFLSVKSNRDIMMKRWKHVRAIQRTSTRSRSRSGATIRLEILDSQPG